ncbi:MAG: hypothetical protein IKF82_00900 [Bacilli bacterium]|nr:hypothetical protein [Bacilli bacterium]
MENKRLTEKVKNADDYIKLPTKDKQEFINKLGELEDLEEQLGCPLEIVFKALTNGVYYEDVANRMNYMSVDLHLNLEGEYVLYFTDEEYLLTKNYKKTWWLKKDKSE